MAPGRGLLTDVNAMKAAELALDRTFLQSTLASGNFATLIRRLAYELIAVRLRISGIGSQEKKVEQLVE